MRCSVGLPIGVIALHARDVVFPRCLIGPPRCNLVLLDVVGLRLLVVALFPVGSPQPVGAVNSDDDERIHFPGG